MVANFRYCNENRAIVSRVVDLRIFFELWNMSSLGLQSAMVLCAFMTTVGAQTGEHELHDETCACNGYSARARHGDTYYTCIKCVRV